MKSDRFGTKYRGCSHPLPVASQFSGWPNQKLLGTKWHASPHLSFGGIDHTGCCACMLSNWKSVRSIHTEEGSTILSMGPVVVVNHYHLESKKPRNETLWNDSDMTRYGVTCFAWLFSVSIHKVLRSIVWLQLLRKLHMYPEVLLQPAAPEVERPLGLH